MEGPADERFDESPIRRVSQLPGRQVFTLLWPIRGPKNGAHLRWGGRLKRRVVSRRQSGVSETHVNMTAARFDTNPICWYNHHR
jgi:hypothetical protein